MCTVHTLLKNAPDDERLHRLFPEWKRLSTILLNDAGFALDFQIATVGVARDFGDDLCD